MTHLATSLLTVLVSISLLSQAEAKSTTPSTETSQCSYELLPDSFQVKWTAFKTTERTGVSGSFNDVQLNGPTKNNDFEELLKGIKVTINKKSINLNDKLKETNLSHSFFSKLLGDNFTGTIRSVNENDRNLVLSLTMNDQTQDVIMDYNYDKNGAIKARGRIDLLAFQAEGALRFLSEKCNDLHKGADGVSKTWPDVDLVLQAKVKSLCG